MKRFGSRLGSNPKGLNRHHPTLNLKAQTKPIHGSILNALVQIGAYRECFSSESALFGGAMVSTFPPRFQEMVLGYVLKRWMAYMVTTAVGQMRYSKLQSPALKSQTGAFSAHLPNLFKQSV
ncbi:hypothetical protein SDJN03_27978, partial [Cucurbita argyrosperma subsp. sororia]